MSAATALFIFLLSILIITILTVICKINAAMVMIGVSFLFGILSGMPFNDVINTVKTGFGSTAGYIGLVILEGVVMGVLLEKTGAISAITSSILKRTGRNGAAVAVNLAGYTLSVPVTCDTGFMVLHPLARGLAVSAGRSLVSVSIALASGLYVAHALIPPTPGPISAAGILNAPGWKVFLLGLAVSLPGIAAGCLWSVKFIGRYDFKPLSDYHDSSQPRPYSEEPSLLESIIPLLVTIVLLVLRAVAATPSRPFGNGVFTKFSVFAGDPVFAIFAGIICSFILVKKGFYREAAGRWIAEGVQRAAPVIILAAAGGGFGAVIKASSMTNAVIIALCTLKTGIFLPFIIAALLKTATGSSTISIITAASVISPLTTSLGIDPVLTVLAVGSGSMMVSHVNDPFFWIVAELSGLDEGGALKYFTPVTAVTGIVTFIFTAFLSLFI